MFVESFVHSLLSTGLPQQKEMPWTSKQAHLLLQVWTKVRHWGC
jgi:hypothetical protein